MQKLLQFSGEVAVVTGAGQGIGKACAEALAGLGATLVIAERDRDEAERAASELRKSGADCIAVVTDVTREADVAALAREVEARWGRAKTLINNAGNNFRTPLADLPTDKWREIISVNLDAVFFMCRAFIPLLLRAERPSIVNIASTYGVVGNAQMPAYCASKGAVVNLTRQLAIDYGPKGLRVNAVCPGPTLTPRLQGYIERGLTSRTALEREIALGRMGECAEIANVVAFLASDAASFVTGAAVVVDGGQTVH